MLYEADAKARLVFVNWYLHSDHDEEIDSKISLYPTVDLSAYWTPQISLFLY
jgi:hypothetical protein